MQASRRQLDSVLQYMVICLADVRRRPKHSATMEDRPWLRDMAHLELHLQQSFLLSSSNQQELVAVSEFLHWFVLDVADSPVWVKGGQDCLAAQHRRCSNHRG